MKNEHDVKATATIAICSFICIMLFKGSSFQEEIFDTITKAVSITFLIRLAYVKFIWKKVPSLRWIHSVPLIEGDWVGKYQSTYESDDNAVSKADSIQVKITQPDIFTIKVTQKTGESLSFSYGENFETLEDGSIYLNYSYKNEPGATLRDKSSIHYGTSRYLLEEAENGYTLKGSYFTDRKTTGTIFLTQLKIKNI